MGDGAGREGESSQGEGRMEDLYSESDLNMTEEWPPAPSATREAPAAEPGAGAGGGGEEGNPPTTSACPGRADFGGIYCRRSSSSDDSRASSDSSNNNDSGNLPVLVRRPARDLKVFGEFPALKSGRTRTHSRVLTMSASCADALQACDMSTVEAKRTVEEEAAEIESTHDSLLEERLEKEREWLEELERRGTLLEQREEEQDSGLPSRNGTRITTRAKYSVTNRDETQRS